MEGGDNVMDEEQKNDRAAERRTQPYRVRLPGFVSDEEVGLGEVVKRATSTVGIRSCGGCNRRAETLNRWFAFSGRRAR
jgi:hypothetical protein